MYIKKKCIRSAERYLNALKLYPRFRIVSHITSDLREIAEKAGFLHNIECGDTILPSIVGPNSDFNAEGKYIKRKDLPKEYRYITTVEWSWDQWCGRDQTETITESRDVYRFCYKRDFTPPPSIELTWIEKEGVFFVSSLPITVKSISEDQLKHIINLFLELFGECEIRKEDLTSFFSSRVRRINWEILPPGEYPWDRVRRHTENLVKDKSPRYSNVILERQDRITNYEPDEVYIGSGGFRAYVAYVFNDKKVVVLESVLTGNATYIFGEDWKEFSAMTKAEILSERLQKDRIIHSKGWETRLQSIMAPERLLAV